MATWKKVLVSGSAGNFTTLQVDNLTSGQVVIGGGNGNLSTTAINGTGTIVATTGASGLVHSGSFSGSFTGTITGTLTGTSSYASNADLLDGRDSTTFAGTGSNTFVGNQTVTGWVSASAGFTGSLLGTASYASFAGQTIASLAQGAGIVSFTYNGSSAQTVAVSGAAALTANLLPKWTGAGFSNSSITDNGTTVSGATSLVFTGTGTSLTGSFTGSFRGDGSGLSGVAANFPIVQKTNIVSTDQFFISDGASKYVTYGDLLTDLAGTNLAVESSDSLTLATTITGITSITSTSFTGSFSGSHYGDGKNLTFITASNVGAAITNNVDNYVLTATGGGSINGESALTFDGSSLNLTGNFTSSGNIAVNGGTIATSAATANIFNTTATTVNIAGAASTATNIGNASGLTTVAGNLKVGGNNVQSSTGGTVLTFSGTNVTAPGNVTISGDLAVNGTTTFINTTNTYIADQLILLASGSTTLKDTGIVAAYSASGVGSAFFLESTSAGSYGRWAVAYDVSGSATTVAADEYVVTAKINQASNPSAAPTWGSTTNGSANMWITNAGDIYIYA